MTTVKRVNVDGIDRPLADPFEISLDVRTSARNVLVILETEAGVRGYSRHLCVAGRRFR
jgi:hypothetical protein